MSQRDRHKNSEKNREMLRKKEKAEADKYYAELHEEEMLRHDLDRVLKERAEVIRAELNRSKQWMTIVQLLVRTQLWSKNVTLKSKGLKEKKAMADAAVKIQNLYRYKKFVEVGRRFRDAVVRLREFINKFISRWREKRRRNASNILREFLVDSDRGGLFFIIKSFVARVLQCQRIWRGYDVCTEVRKGWCGVNTTALARS